MKRILSTIAVLLIFVIQDWAQSPDKVSFQAVIRNASNELINNASIGMQISIHQGAPDGPIVYQERHTPISNQNGLVSLQIGDGTPLAGSIGDIHWESGIFFLQTETDTEGGTEYTISSTSQLLAVPYAFYATTSGSSLPGPAGPQGQPGAKGEKGDPGPQGLQGEAGPQGLQGEKGDAGPAGMQGLQGDTGPQGAKGDKGDIGAVGPKGDKGDAGPGGAQGLQGDTGPQGAKGDKGDTGAVGPKGDKGDVGPGGAQGLQGDTGPQGAKGDKGDTGAVGPKGDKGDTGPAGVQGLQGDTGPQGAKGDKGDMGPAGAQGLQGDTGPQGAKGDKGDTGAVGPKGDKGDQGDSFWKTNAKGIHYDQGNLGIGTAVPNTRLQVEWGGEQADVLSFVEGGLQRFAIEGHTASTPDRMTFKIRGVQALTLYEGGAVGIGTLIPNSSALLDLSSTSKGLLLPRMTTAQRNNIVSPVQGLLVFDNNTESLWYRNSASWKELGGSSGSGGSFIQDSDGNTKVETERNPNEDKIRFSLGSNESLVLTRSKDSSWTRLYFPNNDGNIAIGENTLLKRGTNENVHNVAIGNDVLSENESGNINLGVGNSVLRHNISGIQNVGLGNGALGSNIDGIQNIAIGFLSSYFNEHGSQNIAIGNEALFYNTTGYGNTAIGWSSSHSNIDGHGNTSVGWQSSLFNKQGHFNTSLGYNSLFSSVSGSLNTAIGYNALALNTNSITSTALGAYAGSSSTGNYNILIGYAAGEDSKGSNNILIGNSSGSNVTDSHRLYIGEGDIPLIYGEFDNRYAKVLGAMAIEPPVPIEGDEGQISSYPLLVKGGKQGIAIQVNETEANSENNFISFWDNTDMRGRIEGQSVSDVVLPGLTSAVSQLFNPPTGKDNGSIDFIDAISSALGNNTGAENKTGTSEMNSATLASSQKYNMVSTNFAPGPNVAVNWEFTVQVILLGIEVVRSAIEVASSVASILDPEDIFVALLGLVVASANLSIYVGFSFANHGVAFQSQAGDYAEFLHKQNIEEVMSYGDIVGVRAGEISKTFDLAEHYMVISAAPAVVGKMPKLENENEYEKVGFMGQVPVKVRGVVHKGDYILPSGDFDGLGIAVASDQMKVNDYKRIVGVAWDESDGKEWIKMINTAVGINQNDLADMMEQMQVVMNKMQLALKQVNPEYEMSLYSIDQNKYAVTDIPLDHTVSSTNKSIASKYFEGKTYSSQEEMLLDVRNALIEVGKIDLSQYPMVDKMLTIPGYASQVDGFYNRALSDLLNLVDYAKVQQH